MKALGHDFKRCLNQANLNFKRMKTFKDWTLEMGSIYIKKRKDRNLCCRKWAGVLFYSFLIVKCCWVASRCWLQAEMWTGLQRAVGKMKDENFLAPNEITWSSLYAFKHLPPEPQNDLYSTQILFIYFYILLCHSSVVKLVKCSFIIPGFHHNTS